MTYRRIPYLGQPVTESPVPLSAKHPFTVGQTTVGGDMPASQGESI